MARNKMDMIPEKHKHKRTRTIHQKQPCSCINPASLEEDHLKSPSRHTTRSQVREYTSPSPSFAIASSAGGDKSAEDNDGDDNNDGKHKIQ